VRDSGFYRKRNFLSNLVLHTENINRVAVVSFCPKMVTGHGIDKLGGDTNTVAATTHATLKHIAHAKLTRDLLHISRAAFVGEA
jgi:hypothetical protein